MPGRPRLQTVHCRLQFLDERFCFCQQIPDVALRYPSLGRRRIAFHQIEICDALTDRPERFQRGIMLQRSIEQHFQVVTPLESPSIRQQESLQELLHSLLEKETGSLGVLGLKETTRPRKIPFGDPNPICRIERVLTPHKGPFPFPQSLRETDLRWPISSIALAA